MSTLSSSERLRGRRIYSIFQGLNTVSFLLLSGNIVTLYSLRLGAGSVFVGVISSIQYVGLLFMFIGRRLSGRFGIKPVMVMGWMTRYVLMIPLLISPFMAQAGQTRTALLFVLLGLIGFHFARGVGV
ncbi:MAG TPA: MFS transporter, partial [Spirochaetia bacterium]|nr:MFS transporter [Spirochaetia bacterium]